MQYLVLVIAISLVIVIFRLIITRPENTQWDLGQESEDLKDKNELR